MLRESYVKGVSNLEILAEVKKARIEIEPVTGKQHTGTGKKSYESTSSGPQTGQENP
jgi:hypothetical protein